MSTFVRFWGTRGSIPTPGHKTRIYGGNTSCVEVRIDGTLFVCDGGTGLRELGVELSQTRQEQGLEVHMLFSHTHWDHIQGFPFFMPAYVKQNSLYVYDVGRNSDRVHRLLQGQMQSDYFPVNFSDLGARIQPSYIDGETVIDGVSVRAYEQAHPGRSFAYAFEKNGIKVIYATDNELDRTLLNQDESLRDPEVLRRIPPEFISFVAGADLLIADGQYTDAEYPAKRGWGHARARTVVDLAVSAGVKQCAIFHHDPMHGDDVVETIIQDCRDRAASFGSNVVIFGAREGLELKL